FMNNCQNYNRKLMRNIFMEYRIEYSPNSENHLRKLTTNQQVIILDTIDKQLSFQPDIKTRNRKPMRTNPLAPWELRIGKFRVYYDFEKIPKPIVCIRAIGIKERNIVQIGNKEIKL
ncbi:unnamed protein product, partial [marine sediment metagenome]